VRLTDYPIGVIPYQTLNKRYLRRAKGLKISPNPFEVSQWIIRKDRAKKFDKKGPGHYETYLTRYWEVLAEAEAEKAEKMRKATAANTAAAASRDIAAFVAAGGDMEDLLVEDVDDINLMNDSEYVEAAAAEGLAGFEDAFDEDIVI
jgi:hypothetical protein